MPGEKHAYIREYREYIVYSLHEPLCMRRPSQQTSVLPLSLCSVPFLSHIHDVIATPTAITRSHFDPQRFISVFRPLFLYFPLLFHSFFLSSLSLTLSLSLSLSLFLFLSLSLSLSMSQKKLWIWQGSIHLHDSAISTASCAVQSRMDWRKHSIRKDYEKARRREKKKKDVCEKVRRRSKCGKKSERCSNVKEK